MQTDTEHISLALSWQSVRLQNGAYRVQNIIPITDIPDLEGFRNCTECGIFVDQLDCVQIARRIEKGAGLWIGLVKFGVHHNDVTTLLWDMSD